MKKRRYYLLYDRNCSLCENFKKTIEGLDIYKRIHPLSLQDSRAINLLPQRILETIEDSKITQGESVYLITPEGEVMIAEMAVTQIFRLLPLLGPLGWILEHFPGKNRINPFLYQLFSSHH